MSTYSDTAKKLRVRFRFWKYGVNFFPTDPSGRVYKIVQIIPLDGWTFDPHEITEAIASDDGFRISYSKPKTNRSEKKETN